MNISEITINCFSLDNFTHGGMNYLSRMNFKVPNALLIPTSTVTVKFT